MVTPANPTTATPATATPATATPATATPPDALEAQTQAAWAKIAAAHLGGRNSSAALRSLRDQHDAYYASLIMAVGDTADPEALVRIRDRDIAALDARIAAAEAQEAQERDTDVAWWLFQQVVAIGLDDTSDPVGSSLPAETDSRVTDLADNVVSPDASDNALDLLVGHVPFVVPEATDAAESNTGRLYDVRAGIPAAALPTPSTGVAPPESAIRRPIRFSNSGDTAATVRVASYEPSVGAVGAVASGASTVVFPTGGSSAILDLPVGLYTFCYEWPLGDDADGDGRTDHAHAASGATRITRDSPTSNDSAVAVTIEPLSTNASNGRCGDATTSGPNTPSVLDGGPSQATTPAEAANDGRHTFDLYVVWDDGDRSETVSVGMDLVFTASGLTISGADVAELLGQSPFSLDRTGPNSFFATNADGSATVDVTESGATATIDYGEFFGVGTYVLTRTS